jgi:hypothetical protein
MYKYFEIGNIIPQFQQHTANLLFQLRCDRSIICTVAYWHTKVRDMRCIVIPKLSFPDSKQKYSKI